MQQLLADSAADLVADLSPGAFFADGVFLTLERARQWGSALLARLHQLSTSTHPWLTQRLADLLLRPVLRAKGKTISLEQPAEPPAAVPDAAGSATAECDSIAADDAEEPVDGIQDEGIEESLDAALHVARAAEKEAKYGIGSWEADFSQSHWHVRAIPRHTIVVRK